MKIATSHLTPLPHRRPSNISENALSRFLVVASQKLDPSEPQHIVDILESALNLIEESPLSKVARGPTQTKQPLDQ